MLKLTKVWYLDVDENNWFLVKRHEPKKKKGEKSKPYYTNEYNFTTLKGVFNKLIEMHVRGKKIEEFKQIKERQMEILKIIEEVTGFEVMAVFDMRGKDETNES